MEQEKKEATVFRSSEASGEYADLDDPRITKKISIAAHH